MAAAPVSAARDLYQSLTPALFPGGTLAPSYFGAVPLVNGTQVRPGTGYAVLYDDGGTSEPIGNARDLHTYRLRWEVYADDLDNALMIANAVAWNGGTVRDGLGFDFGTLDVDGFRFNTMRLTAPPLSECLPQAGLSGQRVFRVTLRLEAELFRL